MAKGMRGLAIEKRCTYFFLDLYTGHHNECFYLDSFYLDSAFAHLAFTR